MEAIYIYTCMDIIYIRYIYPLYIYIAIYASVFTIHSTPCIYFARTQLPTKTQEHKIPFHWSRNAMPTTALAKV